MALEIFGYYPEQEKNVLQKAKSTVTNTVEQVVVLFSKKQKESPVDKAKRLEQERVAKEQRVQRGKEMQQHKGYIKGTNNRTGRSHKQKVDKE
jgi:hypothetical protein